MASRGVTGAIATIWPTYESPTFKIREAARRFLPRDRHTSFTARTQSPTLLLIIMIDEEPRPRASSDTRHALTVALVKPGRGACWNQGRNSSSAMLYTRFVIGEET